jgi:hypothetical protein
MATLKMATGSVLDTVVSTANSVGGLFNAASDGVDMLNDYVKTAKVSQTMYNKAKVKNLPNRIKEDIARENVERKLDIAKWLGGDDQVIELYKSELAELDALFADTKSN